MPKKSHDAPSLESISLSIGFIETAVNDMKPEIKATKEGVIRLEERQKHTEERITRLSDRTNSIETSSHDCEQVGPITDLETETTELRVVTTRQTTEIAENKQQLGEMNKSRARFIGYLVTVVLFILAAVGGWVVVFSDMKANVGNLERNQKVIRSDVRELRKDYNKSSQAVIRHITDMTKEVKNGRHKEHEKHGTTVEEWFENLPRDAVRRRGKHIIINVDKLPSDVHL